MINRGRILQSIAVEIIADFDRLALTRSERRAVLTFAEALVRVRKTDRHAAFESSKNEAEDLSQSSVETLQKALTHGC